MSTMVGNEGFGTCKRKADVNSNASANEAICDSGLWRGIVATTKW